MRHSITTLLIFFFFAFGLISGEPAREPPPSRVLNPVDDAPRGRLPTSPNKRSESLTHHVIWTASAVWTSSFSQPTVFSVAWTSGFRALPEFCFSPIRKYANVFLSAQMNVSSIGLAVDREASAFLACEGPSPFLSLLTDQIQLQKHTQSGTHLREKQIFLRKRWPACFCACSSCFVGHTWTWDR